MSEQELTFRWSQDRVDALRGLAAHIFGSNTPATNSTIEKCAEELITFGVHNLSVVARIKAEEIAKFKLDKRTLYLTHLPMEKIQILGMLSKMSGLPEAVVVELLLDLGVTQYMRKIEQDTTFQDLIRRSEEGPKSGESGKSDIEVSREVEEMLKEIMK